MLLIWPFGMKSITLFLRALSPSGKDSKADLTFNQLYQAYQESKTPKIHELFFFHDTRLDLLKLLSRSSRYEKVIAFGHEDVFDEESETQFAVTSFSIADTIAIVFRGTDSSLIGWKEDFNLSYLEANPSQKLAAPYLQDMEQSYNLPLILSGHSKGGNLPFTQLASRHSQRK